MNSREFFLAACNKISDGLCDFGFKASQQCQSLKKTTADKDITFEIFFQSSSLNSTGFVKLLPHLLISSKRLKKWLTEQDDGEFENAMIYGEQLGYMTHFQEWKLWNVSGNKKEQAQEFFLNYLADAGGKGKILNLYKELTKGTQINLMHHEFVDAAYVKLAFLNGLKTSK
ncbi:hypothetical protein HQN84_05235 [Pedobacter steynii]|nr:hypothetical protein [Pedobacter steynii]NQX38237.1 hypothetical protein [Pedobacter steynii]